MYKFKLGRLVLVGFPLIFLTGCFDEQNSAPTPTSNVVMSVEAPGSAYYTSSINGPRYAVILVQNTDTTASANITGISPAGNAAVSIVSRTSSGTDIAYGNYAQCAVTTNSSLNQINTLAPGGECIIVLDGGSQHFVGVNAGTLTINTGGPANSSHTFNLSNTGYLYAGGYFTSVGPNNISYLAKWDGNAWSALGSGVNGGVLALTVDSIGNIYAGGYFTSAGSNNNVGYVAKWDGNAWSTLGPGVNAPVSALVVDSDDHVYVGENFISQVLKWEGSSWSVLGSLSGSGSVSKLAIDNVDHLYAGGSFTSKVAEWNGNSWSGLGALDGNVSALAIDNTGHLYAGGNFTNKVAEWNGNSWSGLGALDGNVIALAIDNAGDFYAGGIFTNNVAQWNGSAWSALGALSGGVNALAIDNAGDLYAGGNFTNNIAKWDSNANIWLTLGPGLNSSVYALTISNVLQVQ